MEELPQPHPTTPFVVTLAPPLAELISLRQTQYRTKPEAVDALKAVLQQAEIRFLIEGQAHSVLIRDRHGIPLARITPSSALEL